MFHFLCTIWLSLGQLCATIKGTLSTLCHCLTLCEYLRFYPFFDVRVTGSLITSPLLGAPVTLLWCIDSSSHTITKFWKVPSISSTFMWNPCKTVHKDYGLSMTVVVVVEIYCSKLKSKNCNIKYETSKVEILVLLW